MKGIFRNVFFVVIVVSLMGCATGKPLLIADLDEIGWDRTDLFQCYLSTQLTLTKLSDDAGAASVSFSRDGMALVRDTRLTIVLPASLEGRILNYNRRDQFLFVAFEEGSAVLPFARDQQGQFSLMTTVDQQELEFVAYEGVRYKASYTGPKPHLNVVINRTQGDLRRQMQGRQVQAASRMEEAIRRISEKFIGVLPENGIIAVLNVYAQEKDSALLITDELQFQLVESGKFRVVDRSSLELIRAEQNFQMSGAVSDESAVSIGNFLGANIVITGEVSGSGDTRRLTMKALDVKTGEIIANAREQL
ncbi:penicillin-binding protein activator LpoB [Treponema sp. TIM-1]|uniref:CsgG/HfaB family protein n=1 Tax=Treponema sp. TIM-1 TaxID=2898417 RepID=UPI00397F5EC3